MRLPQPGGTRHDVMHALEYAAAHSAQREEEWIKMLPYNTSSLASSTASTASTQSSTAAAASHGMHAAEASSTEASSTEDSPELGETHTESSKDTITLDEEDVTVSGLGEGRKVTAADLDSEGESGFGGDKQDIADDDRAAFMHEVDSTEFNEFREWYISAFMPMGRRQAQVLGNFSARRVRLTLVLFQTCKLTAINLVSMF